MTIKLGQLALLSSILVVATSSFARSGATLRNECRWVGQDESLLTPEQQVESEACVPYVTGAADGFILGGGHWCVPSGKGVTNAQMGMVVFKYLEAHPEELHLHTGELVVRALKNAFPCK